MAFIRKNTITLYKCPLELSSRDTLNFLDVNARDNYFNSLPSILYDNFKPVFPGSTIRISDNFLNVNQYNLMKIHYEDETMQIVKDFYCRILDFTYISQKVTEVAYIYDVFLTSSYLLNQTGFMGAWERESVDTSNDQFYYKNDDIPSLKTSEIVLDKYFTNVPGWSTSWTYVVQLNKSIYNYNGNINYRMTSPTAPSTSPQFDIINTNIPGILVLCTPNGLKTVLQNEPAEYVERVYKVPTWALPLTISQDVNYIDYDVTVEALTFRIPINQPQYPQDIFTPVKRKHMAKYPFTAFKCKTNNGDQIFNLSDFDNPREPIFMMATSFTGDVIYIPCNYLGSSNPSYLRSPNLNYLFTVNKAYDIGVSLNATNSLAMYQAQQEQLVDNKYTNRIANNELNINNLNKVSDIAINNNNISQNNQMTNYNNQLNTINKLLNEPITFNDKVNAWTVHGIEGNSSIVGQIYGYFMYGLDVIIGRFMNVVDQVMRVLSKVSIKNSANDVQTRMSNLSLSTSSANARIDNNRIGGVTNSQNDIINANREKAIELNALNISNIGMSASTILPGSVGATLDKADISLIFETQDVINFTTNYFDLKGVQTLRVGNLNLGGKYNSVLKGVITQIPDGLILNDVLGLIMGVNEGIRLWKTTDPSLFGDYSLDNYTL